MWHGKGERIAITENILTELINCICQEMLIVLLSLLFHGGLCVSNWMIFELIPSTTKHHDRLTLKKSDFVCVKPNLFHQGIVF